jgi:hypothetical protein
MVPATGPGLQSGGGGPGPDRRSRLRSGFCAAAAAHHENWARDDLTQTLRDAPDQ